MRMSVCGVLALALLGAPHVAQAGADCSVEATGVAFGAYDPFSTTPDDAAGTIRCAAWRFGRAPDQAEQTIRRRAPETATQPFAQTLKRRDLRHSTEAKRQGRAEQRFLDLIP